MSGIAPTRRSVLVKAAATALAVGALVSVSPATAVAETPAQPTDRVIYWNRVLLDAFREVGGHPGPLTRGGAMLNTAMYDAANSISGQGKPYLTDMTQARGRHGSLNSALDHAAYHALKGAYPQLDFSDELATALALPDSGNRYDKAFGKLLGIRVGTNIVIERSDDGADDATPYNVINEPGYWRPTTPGAGPAGANWGKVKPWVLQSGSQFRPQEPLGFEDREELLASEGYAAQVDEVRRLGGADSTERTADQTEIARFWANDADGTYKPVGQQYEHAIIVQQTLRPHDTSYQTSRLFALLSMGLADAAISVWESKYHTGLWRPETAIKLADTDGNDLTVAHPDWKPLSATAAGTHFSPSFPTYSSGHSGIAAAWAGILQDYFGTDQVSFTGTTDDPNAVGVTRSFTSLSQAAQEKADSRLYAGVHFRMDNDAALAQGYQVADYVYANALK
ncbi:vanadium-dependent haloperoxidase [Streptomyces chitinivorans]|uniref:Vanadium-dependent haloperoxidase n=1 Tax=Streptomyces chitinivorans TaxID=1257027 RepID=A0ABW7HTS3_9ACTN|nr:vanadium-dependent haloperoxidase [Streptomyces chitinivorans]MDH2407272.1 vanadium-dependent haloperoxidase [Streptomyces chitinivorans]